MRPGPGPVTRRGVPAWRNTPARVVEDLADLDAAAGQLGPSRLDVVHHQVQALARSRAPPT